MGSRERIAAVLACAARLRVGSRAQQALADPVRQPLLSDPPGPLKQERSGKGTSTDRVVEASSQRVVAVQREARHGGKVRRDDAFGRVAEDAFGGTDRDPLRDETSPEQAMELGLKGRKVAILATDGVEQVELIEPRKALDAAGAVTHVIAPKEGAIQGMNHDEKGDRIPVDRVLSSVRASEYDALLLPGGVANPDTLRMETAAVQFVREFMLAEKPVAAICHGPWLLVEAQAVSGRTLTSWPSLKTDIRNAGGQWVDLPVSVDEKLITSRKPDDIPAFNAAIVKEFGNRLDDARVDETSEQSLPASDPPPGPSAIGGECAARTP
jgi:protease I